jgi:hypothetical protein
MIRGIGAGRSALHFSLAYGSPAVIRASMRSLQLISVYSLATAFLILLATSSVCRADDTKESEYYRLHALLGVSGAPYAGYDLKGSKQGYLGFSALPEFRFAVTIDRESLFRAWASFRWSALSVSNLLTTNPTIVAPTRANGTEFAGALGVTVVPAPGGARVSTFSSSIAGFSIGLGYGSFRTANGYLVAGPTVVASFDLDLISINFSRMAPPSSALPAPPAPPPAAPAPPSLPVPAPPASEPSTN